MTAFSGDNKKEKITMNIKEATKVLTAATVVAGMVMCASASIWSTVVKGCEKAMPQTAEKAAAKTGGKVVGKAVSASAGRSAASALRGVTPGKIMAAGVAVAAVKVGHGAQELQTSIGTAVENNPELAPDVAGKIAKPFAAVSKTIAVVLTLLALWFVWPFVRCARAWLQLICISRAKSRSAASGPVSSADRSIVPGVLFVLLIATAAVGLSGCDRANAAEEDRGTTPVCVSVADNEAYRRDVERAKMRFDERLMTGCQEDFADVRAMIPTFVEKYGYYSHCCSLVKSLVWDRLSGKATTEQKVRDDIEEGFYASIVTAREQMIERVRAFARELEQIRVSHGSPMIVCADMPVDDTAKFADLLELASDNVEEVKGRLMAEQNGADFTLVLEAVMIRETVAAIATLLEGVVAREATSIATAGATSLADGPLPIGECVGAAIVVGTTAWSGYDLYKAAYALPRELSRAIEHTVDACAAQSAAETTELAERLVKIYTEGSR